MTRTDAPSTARDVEVCVVGAGPHALAVVTHLVTAKPSLRNDIVVLDPSGEWLHTWRSQFARLEIDVLRSPIVHHPEVAPGALAQYVAAERLPRSKLPYDPPFASTFESFCSRSIARHDLADLPVAARVVAMTTGDGADEPTTVTTDAGSFRARHVIWAANTCEPIVPHSFADLTGDQPLVEHAAHVDLRSIDSMDGEHLIVVGGGLTAGHLAVGARARGATVTLVTRRPIVERNFDVEPGWLGPRYLDGFQQECTAERRLHIARTARGGGTMPGWMCQRLRDEIQEGQVDHVIGEIDHVESDHAATELMVSGASMTADRCWLATGTTPDARADGALGAVVHHHVDGVPVVDTDLRCGEAGPFVTGRLAAIELGPAAGNLWGARMAARRICRALTHVDLDTDAVATIPPPPPSSRQKGRPT